MIGSMSEKIIIVDENNKVIGSKARGTLDYEVDIYRSTGIWITNSKDEILLAQRSLNKEGEPGKWGPAAAGTVEVEETYESNAYKELEEEVGISGVKLTTRETIYLTKARKQFIRWFEGTTDLDATELKLQESEVAAAKWISVDELAKDIDANPNKYVGMLSVALKILGHL